MTTTTRIIIDTDILIDVGRGVQEALVYVLSHGLLLADAMIAATAIALHVPLASKNQRDYRYITQLTLLPYPS
ncbi:hypothetical protein EYB53_023090 [Candidatus Chloroploca sp. M-50]|uniref:PIN domain-containing protein n=1 Tax=Candidatus Chloroploca mongolica TaxID=2528176 RepID=A0ABS4DGQ9_9CHLR|nr:hypothetical protein [Candidatus Chloroploca mongolica]MBP1468618.1 hypothetical protein [Candidatus Chloroploca mongolica]